jgi:GPH family glycoside/pentoside/hexuronide:cation symporter
MAFWLMNYLTDTVGLAAGLAGVAILIGKIWDGVTDPLVGYLSDRTHTKWGRRRPYIFAGAIPLFLAMIFMFTNPDISNQTLLFVWAIAAFCILGLAYTLVNIPYSSLTPELTQDFHERTSLNGFRFGFAIFGTLLGAGAVLPFVQLFPNRSTGFSYMGIVFGGIMMITALITFFVVKERQPTRSRTEVGFFPTYLRVFKNRPYVIILLTFTMNMTAVNIVSGILIYYFKYIYQEEAKTTLALLILLVTAMVFIPLSVIVAKKVGKKVVYATGLGIIALGTLLLFFFGHILGIGFAFGMMGFAGIGLATTYVIPWSMVPDTIEYDYSRSGKRTEGAYYGIWTFVSKVGNGLAIGISGGVLSLTGYVAGVAQTETAKLGIRLIAGPIPAAIFIAGAIILLFYPITEEKYREIMEKVARMDKEEGEQDSS